MPALTDGQIRNALKRVAKTQKSETLSDGDGQNIGRLILVIKPMPKRVVAYWYAQQYINGKRKLRKIGAYPGEGLSHAREIFARDFAGVISSGRPLTMASDTRPGNVEDLFTAYADSLEAAGKSSHAQVRRGLEMITDQLGALRPARDITNTDIIAVLRPIYDRNSPSMADHVRSYIRSAFTWGLQAENDYRSNSSRRFRLTHNPAADIRTEAKTPGQHWLRESDWVRLWTWLQNPPAAVYMPYVNALRLLMLTGQRVQEICQLRVSQYDRDEATLEWAKTKNTLPHMLPLPSLAVELLNSLEPNEHGLFFPSAKRASEPVSHGALYAFVGRQQEKDLLPDFTNRDLRRTFKTLAGKAGLSKEIRDRLQNHTEQDVGSRSYDRYGYMTEKRAAMDAWDKFVRKMIDDHKPPRMRLIHAA